MRQYNQVPQRCGHDSIVRRSSFYRNYHSGLSHGLPSAARAFFVTRGFAFPIAQRPKRPEGGAAVIKKVWLGRLTLRGIPEFR